MSYINVGATIKDEFGVTNDCPTKAALKRAIKESPETVTFYSTSPMGPQFNGKADDMPEEHSLIVAGPNPYTSRKWFANVKRDGAKITVS